MGENILLSAMEQKALLKKVDEWVAEL